MCGLLFFITLPTLCLSGTFMPANYNRVERPSEDGDADVVQFGMFVHSVGPVEESSMRFQADFYIRQYWQDARLVDLYNHYKTGNESSNEVVLGREYLDLIWRPDIYWPNAIHVSQPGVISRSLFLMVDRNGTVFYSTRLLVTQRCELKLRFFPFDQQNCQLSFESYKYSDALQEMSWVSDTVSMSSNQITANFEVDKKIDVSTKVKNYGIGLDYTALSVHFTMWRKVNIYILNLFLPSVSLVILSWVGFWISKTAVPARAGLAITTVLAQITLITGTSSKFPGIADMKMADLYLIVNFFYVFASLIEFAVVSYKDIAAKGPTQNNNSPGSANDPINPSKPNNPVFNHRENTKMRMGGTQNADGTWLTESSLQSPYKNRPTKNSSRYFPESNLNQYQKSLKFLNKKRERLNISSGSSAFSVSDQVIAGDILDEKRGNFEPEATEKPAKQGPYEKAYKDKNPVEKFFSREYWTSPNADNISKWLFPLTFLLWNVAYFWVNLSLSGRIESMGWGHSVDLTDIGDQMQEDP